MSKKAEFKIEVVEKPVGATWARKTLYGEIAVAVKGLEETQSVKVIKPQPGANPGIDSFKSGIYAACRKLDMTVGIHENGAYLYIFKR